MSSASISARASAGNIQPLLDNPPNARRTMEALRELGYDSYASILDLIDNCVDAGATSIEVNVSEHRDDIAVVIDDDGCGMDATTLSEALRLGSDTVRESGDLGKFGMGLVTASIGLSQKVEVLTKETDSEVFYGAFDLEEIAECDQFVKRVGPADSNQTRDFDKPRGTRITLSKTDRISNRRPSEFANRLRKKIGQVFRKFLKSGLKIQVNGTSVDPIDPLMLSHADTRLVLEMDIPIEGGAATLRVVDLPDLGSAGNTAHGIIPQNSGFYVVRNNREIMEAQTFDFYKKHPDYSHFRAELSFDGALDEVFHTDVKKMSIQLSQAFIDRLRQATQALITESGRHGRARANVARGQVDHSVAEANITRRAPLIPKPKELVERRARRSAKGTKSKGNGSRQRSPHLTDLRTVSGLKVVFNEGDYGEQGTFYLVKQDGRTITITYNREHPFWRELIEHADTPKVVAILDYLVFALANSELLVPEQANIVKVNVNSTLVGLLV